MKKFNISTPKKAKKIRNQEFFKRGSYSLAITAIVLVGIIVANVLVGVLSGRFLLEFDMTSEKTNSFTKENAEFIKQIKDDVTITLCSNAENYTGGMMTYYAQDYGVYDNNATPYYRQTINLLQRYNDYNKNIKVEFIDTQSVEFSAIASTYSDETLKYGDIIVSAKKDGKERYKVVTFTDIYALTEGSASYYGESYTVNGNNIETAVTSAIAYVTAGEVKKAALITGHTKTDYTGAYVEMLKANNYDVEIISDSILTKIPEEFDIAIIVAPSSDFIGAEIEALSNFLDNDGKLGKGLLFFGDVYSPYLTNLYDFLAQWGVSVEEGVVYETNDGNYMPDDPTTIGTFSSGKDAIASNVNVCITGYNIPITPIFEEEGAILVTSLIETPTSDSAVVAPVGTAAGWSGAADQVPACYSGIIQSKKYNYDSEGEYLASYVMTFSSIEFIYSQYTEQASISNKDITLAVTERAAGAEDTGIQFVPKTITTESFANEVTEDSVRTISIIFIILLPLSMIALSIIVYFRRKNS